MDTWWGAGQGFVSTLEEFRDMKELLMDWLVLFLMLFADLEANDDVLILLLLLNLELEICFLFFPIMSVSIWSDFFYFGY